MATIEHVRARIAEIAERRKNVEIDDVQWVVTHLGLNGYEVSSRKNDHATIFRVGKRPFSACTHNRGSKQIKKCYVDDFIDAMEELGLYES